MDRPRYYDIVEHYRNCFEKHGATAKGMDWPNERDLGRRFQVMLGVIGSGSSEPISILDLGCGIGLMVNHLKERKEISRFGYWGIDISEEVVTKARELHPGHRFEARDILKEPLPTGCVDYIVMNGLLTEKISLTQEKMESYAKDIIRSSFNACRIGIAFNVMSTHVDWTRLDLFHWGLDDVTEFLIKDCSRNIVIRMDYGLYEYTVYVYREPNL